MKGDAAAKHGAKVQLSESRCYPSGHNGKYYLGYVAESKFSDEEVHEIEPERM